MRSGDRDERTEQTVGRDAPSSGPRDGPACSAASSRDGVSGRWAGRATDIAAGKPTTVRRAPAARTRRIRASIPPGSTPSAPSRAPRRPRVCAGPAQPPVGRGHRLHPGSPRRTARRGLRAKQGGAALAAQTAQPNATPRKPTRASANQRKPARNSPNQRETAQDRGEVRAPPRAARHPGRDSARLRAASSAAARGSAATAAAG